MACLKKKKICFVEKGDTEESESDLRKEELARPNRKMSAKEKLKLKLEKKKSSSSSSEHHPKLSRQSSRVEERLKVRRMDKLIIYRPTKHSLLLTNFTILSSEWKVG